MRSRFVKASFILAHSVADAEELSCLNQYFHMFDSVSFVRGNIVTPEGKYNMTTYSCCMSADSGTYYYKTYDNYQISAVSVHGVDIDDSELSVYDLRTAAQYL